MEKNAENKRDMRREENKEVMGVIEEEEEKEKIKLLRCKGGQEGEEWRKMLKWDGKMEKDDGGRREEKEVME